MNSNINSDDFIKYFHHVIECFHTNGTQEGLILKFCNFYLKVYDNEKNDSYIIEKYCYGIVNPIKVDTVPFNRIREYASYINNEHC